MDLFLENDNHSYRTRRMNIHPTHIQVKINQAGWLDNTAITA